MVSTNIEHCHARLQQALNEPYLKSLKDASLKRPANVIVARKPPCAEWQANRHDNIRNHPFPTVSK